MYIPTLPSKPLRIWAPRTAQVSPWSWEITKDKCDSTRAHRRHLAANGKHENKRKIYCTSVHLRIIGILFTLMYNLSAVTAAITLPL